MDVVEGAGVVTMLAFVCVHTAAIGAKQALTSFSTNVGAS